MNQTGIFAGRVKIPYAYGCFGWTRGGGNTWHGGIDLVGVDDDTVRMPYYTAADGSTKAISGTVVTARIVTDRETNRSKGFGFVEMPNDAEARQAIEALNGQDLGGRKAVVNEARPREERPRTGGFGGERRGGFGGGERW